MKKFVFSMQKVLDLRMFAEEEAKIALAEAISVADKIKAELALVAQNRVKAHKSRSAHFDVTEQLVIEHYIQRLDLKKEELLLELAEAELVIEEKRGAMMEAMKERKVLSNLRDKKLSEYKKLSLRESDEELDDITQPQYALKAGA